MEDRSVWQIRATAYELLALSFRYPEKALVRAIVSGEWADAVSEVAAALEVPLEIDPAEGAVLYADCDEGETLHMLRRDATRLFVGAPEPEVSPYEGVWRAKDDGVRPLLFVNPHSMDVERFMKACGVGQPEDTNEPLDHIATEMELLQWLSMVEAGMASLPGHLDAAFLPGGSAAAAHDEFLVDHVRVWVPRFSDEIAEKAREPFYRMAAQALKAFVG